MYYLHLLLFCSVFFFNDTATTEIYTLSLHDALPICPVYSSQRRLYQPVEPSGSLSQSRSGTRLAIEWKRASDSRNCSSARLDRKSTRLNSSHANISYAVFCLKKKKKNHKTEYRFNLL